MAPWYSGRRPLSNPKRIAVMQPSKGLPRTSVKIDPRRYRRRCRSSCLRSQQADQRHRPPGPRRVPSRPSGAVHRGGGADGRLALGHRRRQPARSAASHGRWPRRTTCTRSPNAMATRHTRASSARSPTPCMHRSALQQVIDAIADPAVAVVTSTVTEKGYSQNPATFGPGGRRRRHPPRPVASRHAEEHARRAGRGHSPPPRRRAAHASCAATTWPNNGDTLRKLLVQYAGLLDPALARRIEHDIALPNSMVDRIVPAATPDSLAWAAQRLGLRDEAAIVCEPFTQWVIEDRFAGPRPAWEDAGALLTERRAPVPGDEAAPAQRHAFGDRLCRPAVRPRKRLRCDGRPRRRLVRPRRDGTTCAPPWPYRPGTTSNAIASELLRRFREPGARTPHAADRDGRHAESCRCAGCPRCARAPPPASNGRTSSALWPHGCTT